MISRDDIISCGLKISELPRLSSINDDDFIIVERIDRDNFFRLIYERGTPNVAGDQYVELSTLDGIEIADLERMPYKIGEYDELILETETPNSLQKPDIVETNQEIPNSIVLDYGLDADDFPLWTQSFKIRWRQFKDIVLNRVFSRLGLGNAAFLGENDLSKIAHGHNYTYMDIHPCFGPDGFNPTYKSQTSCVNVGYIETTRYGTDSRYGVERKQICVPKFKETIVDNQQDLGIYNVGDVEFRAVRYMKSYLTGCCGYKFKQYGNKWNIDINDPSFNGFVIPNGTTFPCEQEQFTDACRYFSGNPDDTQFTVPNMEGFFRVNNNTDSTFDGHECSAIGFSNAMQSHKHTFQPEEIGEQVIKIPELELKADGQGSITNHNVFVSRCKCKLPIFIKKLEIKSVGDVSLSCGQAMSNEKDLESYPAFNDIPALIYIGLAT